jgi:hypothetical protein
MSEFNEKEMLGLWLAKIEVFTQESSTLPFAEILNETTNTAFMIEHAALGDVDLGCDSLIAAVDGIEGTILELKNYTDFSSPEAQEDLNRCLFSERRNFNNVTSLFGFTSGRLLERCINQNLVSEADHKPKLTQIRLAAESRRTAPKLGT